MSGQSETDVQALRDTVRSMFQDTTVNVSDDIHGFTETVVEYIYKTKEATVPKTTVFHSPIRNLGLPEPF